MQGEWIQQNVDQHGNPKPNRSQKRQRRKMRGVGWTRQFSSARARRKNGTPCLGDYEHQVARLRAWQREMAKIQERIEAAQAAVEAEEISDEDLEAAAEFLTGETSLTGVDLHHEEVNVDALAEALAQSGAKGLIADINAGNHDQILTELRAAEEANKGRVTVLRAIDARL
jgi:hypothetical protein